jgi:hypothetical protein
MVRVDGAEVLAAKFVFPRYFALRLSTPALLNDVLNVAPGAAVPSATVPL